MLFHGSAQPNENLETMKHSYLFAFLTATIVATALPAQYNINFLDTNDVDAMFHANGLISYNTAGSGGPYFQIPRSADHTSPSPLFSASMWIGGVDSSGTLRLAAERFEQMGLDYFPGPLGTNASITPATSAQFDQVWKVDQSDVDRQLAYFHCLYDPNCDTQAEFPGYTVPASFFSWPAHGDMSLGQAYDLAPFIDFDGDGNYNPEHGDAPCISGDQALFAIYNDMLQPHTESGGDQIGLEVHMMPFAFASDVQAIDQTIFIRYRLINRGPHTLHDTYVGIWNDFDLGGASDDFVGCDAGRSLFYVYNGDSIDEPANGHPGYGLYPPAFGEVFLQGPLMDPDGTDNSDTLSLPGYNGTDFNDSVVDNERLGMSYFLYHNNAGGASGDPDGAQAYYGYLRGQWQDGTPLTYGGNGYSSDSTATHAHYMFPGDSDSLGVGTNGLVMPPWTETTAGNAPEDRRGMASMGPFTFAPGQEEVIVVAYVYARALSGDLYASVHALQQRTDSIRAFAEATPGILGTGPYCSGIATGISSIEGGHDGMGLFPNPANDRLHIMLPLDARKVAISVYDSQGALVLEQEVNNADKAIDVARLSPGLYMVRAETRGKAYSKSFLKE